MKPNWFVGLPVDQGRWFAPLVREPPYKVRVFHPLDIHITVAFLGAVGEERARLGWQQVAGQHRTALTVSLGAVAPMGNPRRPSALSVLLEHGQQEVAARIGEIRQPIWQAAEARPDDRPPKPHITIARPTRSASSAQRRRAIAWAESLAPAQVELTLDRIALYTWAQDRRERQFRIVEQTQWTAA